jgi:quaternary ammonium compound-resistance protein SugE
MVGSLCARLLFAASAISCVFIRASTRQSSTLSLHDCSFATAACEQEARVRAALSHACRANIARRTIGHFVQGYANAQEPSGVNHYVGTDEPMSAWLALLAAGLLEVAWALGLKYSDGLTRFWPTAATAVAIVLSFALMALALRSLPFGTAYAVWTGIGAVGSIIVGMILYSEPTDPVRLICLTLIVAGMIGLKLNSPI